MRIFGELPSLMWLSPGRKTSFLKQLFCEIKNPTFLLRIDLRGVVISLDVLGRFNVPKKSCRKFITFYS